MRRRTSAYRSVTLALAVGLVVAACSGSETGSGAFDLSSVALSSTSAVALDRVDLLGVPTNVDLATSDVLVITGDGEIPLPILADDGEPYILAPLHPSDPSGGGTVELVFEHSGERSAHLALEVSPLPQAPGAWDEVVALLRAAIAERAEEGGLTFDQLQAAAFEDLAPEYQPLKLAQAYLDDGTENDLESLLTASANGLSDSDRAMIDALVARLDLASLIGGGAAIDSFMGDRGGHRSFAPALAPGPTAAVGGLDCRDAGIQVVDAADLAAMITQAKDSVITPGGAERQVLNDIGTVTAYGGFLPVVGPFVGATGTLFTAIEAYKNGVAGLYPSKLLSLTADVTGVAFPEDFLGPEGWDNVMVKAVSTGWDANADIANVVLSAASTTGSFFAGSRLVNASDAEGFAIDVMLSMRDNAGNALVAEYVDVLSFCPEDWTVPITGEPWSKATARLERFEVDSTALSFQPATELGLNLPFEDTLRIEADPDRFAGEQVHTDLKISAHPIQVEGIEEIMVKTPGKPIDVSMTVHGAIDPTLDWQSQKGAWTGDPTITSTGDPIVPGLLGSVTWTRTHVTPTSESDYPYLATVESSSRSGLRADGDPPRLKVITVRLADIIVEPNPVTMATETTQQFTARDRNGNTVAVNWAATGGSISDTGLYTAGSTAGTFTVTATSRENSELQGTAAVTIIEVRCPVGRWTMLNPAEYIGQIAAQTGMEGSYAYGGGDYFLTFGLDGTFTGERVGLTLRLSSSDGSVTTILDLADVGTWSHDEETRQLTINGGSSSGSARVIVGEQSIEMTVDLDSVPALGGTGTYSCANSNLTVSFGVYNVVLGPAGS